MTTFPINKKIYITEESDSFAAINYNTETELPISSKHVGGFGHVRKNHVHEGVDIYCNEGEPVFAIEDGTVVLIENFTGSLAFPPSPWWENTRAVHIEGKSGVIVYGEITEAAGLIEGMYVCSSQYIGNVQRVLRNDKGRPMSMLHVELYKHGNRESVTWNVGEPKPENLLDPTRLLFESITYTE